MKTTIGSLVQDFFLGYLKDQKGLRPTSVKSYRDSLKLFLPFVAERVRRPISKLAIEDITFESVVDFLRHLEVERKNAVSTRNQRLAALRTFFEYLGRREPEWLGLCQRVGLIPTKRCSAPDTNYIDRGEVEKLFERLPTRGPLALRDRALIFFLYNTGARVQEVADLKVDQLDLASPGLVRLHGKGDKWRTCPLSDTTCKALASLIRGHGLSSSDFVFCSQKRLPMTRFGIYKRVRLLTRGTKLSGSRPGRETIGPHVWRHTTAVHLLEAGNEPNLIRAWLGHVSLDTTNRYAEITMRMKAEALQHCVPHDKALKIPWKDDSSLMRFLTSI